MLILQNNPFVVNYSFEFNHTLRTKLSKQKFSFFILKRFNFIYIFSMKISCLFFINSNFNTRFIKLSCLTLCEKNSIQININENFNINKFKCQINFIPREFYFFMFFFLYFASITIWIKVNISSLRILRIRLNNFQYDRSK